jgi:hypothetical protein
MNKILSIILLISSTSFAQNETVADTTWQKELIGSLSFSESYFDNWAAGGENAIAGQLDLGGKLIYNNEKYTWTNTGKIAYGSSKIADAEAKKTIDELKIESLVSYITEMFADPYFAFKAETQLAPGYTYTDDEKIQVSAFMDPGYFTQSLGLKYDPTECLSIRFGGAIKETLTRDYPAPYADDSDTEEIEKTKVEPGAETVIGFSKNISETTQITSTIDLFNNFKSFDATDAKWDTDITTKITEYINVKLSVKIFYDKDISPKRQLNQALMLGISYTFF